MGFSPNKLITLNMELLYQQGDVLMCPLCRKEHYKIMRPIYKGDHVTAGQVEAMSDDILNPAFKISERCQFCHGGYVVGLVQKVEGKELK